MFAELSTGGVLDAAGGRTELPNQFKPPPAGATGAAPGAVAAAGAGGEAVRALD